MRTWTLLFAAAAWACTSGGVVVTPENEVPARIDVDLNRDFTMGVRDTVHVEDVNLMLYFSGVSGDSRCPLSLWCVWSGDATVHLQALSEIAEFEPQAITLHTSLEPHAVRFMNVTIRLVYLNPYPQTQAPIDPWSYEATIRVTR